jgi:serine/threonine protein kinase
LQAFGLGKLDRARSLSVSRHLDGCDTCLRRVAELSSDDSPDGLQRAQGYSDEGTTEPPPPGVASTAAFVGEPASPRPDDMAPPELGDHANWEIIRELGRGGMGIVYLAKNRLMGRMEVLKVVASHLIEHPGVFERFLREIQAAARLQHVNIVTAYTAVQLGSSLVFAMEFVDGLDLATVVKTKGPLPIADAAYFIQQVALGLQHAHDRGMVHRDIKPANLILARDGKKSVVKILDFGLAKVTSEGQADSTLTREGQMMGTPDFIAPEQIRDAKSADIRADIYSLGCTLYYLLSGVPPFRCEHVWDVYKAHFSIDARQLNLVRPEVPVELAAVVAKMMAKEPGRRFHAPAQVAQALVPFFKKASSTSQGSDTEVSQMERPTPQANRTESPIDRTEPAASPAPGAAQAVQASPRPPRRDPKRESLIELNGTEPLMDAAPRTVAIPRVPKRSRPWLIGAAAILLLGPIALSLAHKIMIPTKGREPPLERQSPSDNPVAIRRSNDEPSLPKKGSTPFTVVSGQWHVEGNELVQTDTARPFNELLFGDTEWTDYEFTVTARRMGGLDSFALFVRSDHGSTYAFTASGTKETPSSAELREAGHASLLGNHGFSIKDRQWYTALIHVQGDHFVCSIYDNATGTDVHLFDFHDNHHAKGRVGLQTFGSSVRFKAIRVTSLDGKVLWEGPPAIEASANPESPKRAD